MSEDDAGQRSRQEALTEMLSKDERVAILKAQPDAKVLLLHEGDVRRALVGFEGRAYHYVRNVAGERVLLVFAGLFLAAAACVVWMTGAAILPWRIAVVVCAVASMALLWFVATWHRRAGSSFVALDQEHLFVGDRKRAWRVAWEMLDVQSMGFDKFSTQSGRGALDLQVGGQQIELILYHPLMHLEDLQGFMVEVLTMLKQDEAVAALREEGAIDAGEDEEA